MNDLIDFSSMHRNDFSCVHFLLSTTRQKVHVFTLSEINIAPTNDGFKGGYLELTPHESLCNRPCLAWFSNIRVLPFKTTWTFTCGPVHVETTIPDFPCLGSSYGICGYIHKYIHIMYVYVWAIYHVCVCIYIHIHTHHVFALFTYLLIYHLYTCIYTFVFIGIL